MSNEYLCVDDLEHRKELLDHCEDIILWSLKEWDNNVKESWEFKDIKIGGSFEDGTAQIPESDIDIIAIIYINFDIFDGSTNDAEEIGYALESQVWPSRIDELYQYIEYNVSDIDILLDANI